MSNNKYEVLCLIDSDEGRDVEMCIPVVYFLEKHLNCSVEFRYLWDMYAIKRTLPDVVLIPNTVGHHLYVETAKYCVANGIPCFAMESEGNFVTDGSYEYGGYNKGSDVIQEWLCCWSERTANYLRKIKTEDSQKVVVTGGPGFDRFLIYSFMNRSEFLNKHGKLGYTKVIGYGGWAFGRLFGKRSKNFFTRKNEDPVAKRNWILEQRIIVRDILEELVINNQDTLFIFKRHPKEFWEDEPVEKPNEMNEILDHPNVLYIVHSETLQNVINVCDIWMGFETTTCVEAWLLNKPTILINNQPDFPRSDLNRGSIKARSYQELQQLIDGYYREGNLEGFEKLELLRHELIKNSIGFSDGFNHIRTAYYFQKTLQKVTIEGTKKRNVKISLKHLRLYYLYHVGKYFFNKRLFLSLPKFKKTIFIFEKWRMQKIPILRERYYEFMDRFYSQTIVEVSVNDKNWWKKFNQRT